ncbi:AAA family ATPase [Pseudonocardia sp. N23]|uniref:AAA family ATPase n=1 Tax=Pseudonocardia sp. N23 TaxID=1987376 RepID=UPI00267A116D
MPGNADGPAAARPGPDSPAAGNPAAGRPGPDTPAATDPASGRPAADSDPDPAPDDADCPGQAAPSTGYPFDLPVVAALRGRRLELGAGVTFLVGENGSGKSTLVEAIAVAAGFNAEGGSRSFRFSTRSSESALGGALRVGRAPGGSGRRSSCAPAQDRLCATAKMRRNGSHVVPSGRTG